MKNLSAACTFVEVVHVLCYDVHVKPGFESGQREMPLVGTGGDNLTTALVVEFQHELRIGLKALW